MKRNHTWIGSLGETVGKGTKVASKQHSILRILCIFHNNSSTVFLITYTSWSPADMSIDATLPTLKEINSYSLIISIWNETMYCASVNPHYHSCLILSNVGVNAR